MTAQVNNNAFSNIGRMFARRNAPEVYGLQQSAATMELEAAPESGDRVSLSPFAPKPLDARFLEEALDTARLMESGKKLSAGTTEKLREDRIFTAVAALAVLGNVESETGLERAWPGGLPAPTREEMEVARRRLTQRLRGVDMAANPETVQVERADLLRRVGKRDFSSFEGQTKGVLSAAGASA